MKIVNVHQRLLHASPERVAAVVATLGSPGDLLWPRTGFPRMVLDQPLAVGATGGHGPIRYTCTAYEPESRVRFRFKHVEGWHQFEILDATEHHCVLEHRMQIDARGAFLLRWLFVVRPLHDACLEDMLSQAEASLGLEPRAVRWSPYVRLLMKWMTQRAGERKLCAAAQGTIRKAQ
jgi:hypothetical protein